MESYELAYRMQMEVPGVIDLQKEPENIREMYGLNEKETAPFGKQCLMARRMIRKGRPLRAGLLRRLGQP